MNINLPISDFRDDDLGDARPMTRNDFNTVFNAIREQALSTLLEHGQSPPTVYLLSLDSEGQILRVGVMPVGDLVNQPVGKNILAMLITRLMEDPNHDFVIFAHEAWVLRAQTQNPQEIETLREAFTQSLEHHPKRTEALVLSLRSKDDQALAALPIERDADGSVARVEDAELMFSGDQGQVMEGRFAAPGRPPGATLH